MQHFRLSSLSAAVNGMQVEGAYNDKGPILEISFSLRGKSRVRRCAILGFMSKPERGTLPFSRQHT